jgi:hypothetical protein
MNEKYSFRSFKNQSLVELDPEELNDSEIVGTSFFQREPFTVVFPKNLKGIVFSGCNLDNCILPEGAIMRGGTNRQYAPQNDGEYWIIDETGNPVSPRDHEKFDRCGISKDPRNIPVEPLAESITFTNDPARIERQKIDALANDRTRLKDILVLAGELSASVATAIRSV